MGRRRTKRTSFFSIFVLEVGSLLGIVALAQPSLWQTVTGQSSSDNQSASRFVEHAPASNVYPPNSDDSYLADSQFADSRMVAPLRVARSAEHRPLWATKFPPGPLYAEPN